MALPRNVTGWPTKNAAPSGGSTISGVGGVLTTMRTVAVALSPPGSVARAVMRCAPTRRGGLVHSRPWHSGPSTSLVQSTVPANGVGPSGSSTDAANATPAVGRCWLPGAGARMVITGGTLARAHTLGVLPGSQLCCDTCSQRQTQVSPAKVTSLPTR